MSLFRELFVEVPLAILEAKVRQQTPQVEPLRLDHKHQLAFEYSIREIAKHVDGATWVPVETCRASDSNRTLLRVKLACGHRGWFTLDEDVLAFAAVGEIVDYIRDTLGSEPLRRCTCVPSLKATCTAFDGLTYSCNGACK